jgi:flagellar protein FlaJ
MKFKIPFTISDVEILKRRSKRFLKYTRPKRSKLDNYLAGSGTKLDRRQYLAICYRAVLLNLLVFSVIITSILGVMPFLSRGSFSLSGNSSFFVYGLLTAILITGLIFMNQLNYPKIFALNKERNIERNLIPVLQDMMVQLNSGVLMFNIIINISESGYGEASEEFKKIAREINAGVPQIEAIEKHAKINTSKYFRRVLWQISNGMRSGTDMTSVIKEGIDNLIEEQTIQIQSYGGKLNPLIMFYMLIAVIMPALGITFIIIISSILNFPKTMIYIIFFFIFGFVVFMQIMFHGLIKSRRPSLL